MVYNSRKFKKESARPQVGIWWNVKGSIQGVIEPAPYPLDYSYTSLMHYDQWESLNMPGGSEVAHERGRVESTPTGFHILTSQNMAQNDTVMRRVMRYFSLPPNKTKIIVDEHYNRTPEDEMYDALMSGDRWQFGDDDFYTEEAA